MRRPSPWFLLPILGAVAVGAFWTMRPHWRTASKAEVKAWLDPAFKEVEAPDPAAQARFERLRKTMLQLGYAPKGNPQLVTLMRILAKPSSTSAEALWKLSGEGPAQRPPGASSPTSGHLRLLAEASANVGENLARQGDSATAGKRLATALWVANQIGPDGLEFFDPGDITRALRILDDHLDSALPHLEAPALTLLAERMPVTDRANITFRRALADNLRTELIPVLADPEGWAKTYEPNAPPEQTMDAILMGDPSDDLHRGHETYDAELTVRNVNRIFVPILDGAMREPAGYDRSGETFAKDLDRYLPVSGAAGKQGWERKWKELQYHWQLARTRNSYGDRLLKVFGNFLPMLLDDSYQAITLRESMRTRVALWRYQRQFGRPAPSLDALVKSGLLPTLPIDGYAAGNLRYDPVRKRIWSVGDNRKDDGGTAARFGQLFQPDYVWETP